MLKMLRILWLVSLIIQCYHCLNLTYRVKEENSPITYIGSIATNKQFLNSFSSEELKVITFNQLQQKEAELFNVTTTGKLYTLQTIDAESLCRYNKECSKVIKVAVHKQKTFVRILKVKIIIDDINDHQPEFPDKEITLHFREGDGKGMKKSIPNAIDKDVGFKNRLIHYKLRQTNHSFSLEVFKHADGVSYLQIVLEEKLDREVKESYNVEVIAEDRGTPAKQSVLNVKIIVDDENDNRPVFAKRIYNVSVAKTHKTNIPVVIVSAQDSDRGDNRKISYHFSPMTSEMDSTHFQLKPDTGEIFLTETSSLQEKVIYELFIEARDGGNPPLSSIATVMVNVINQQNNAPNIDVNFISTRNHNTATILEDIKVEMVNFELVPLSKYKVVRPNR
ncbi:protocadherin-17 [Octopus bimaculoides]|nr:protocadherin-17 [Octopus bimaculoides]